MQPIRMDSIDNAVRFLREASKYFNGRPTNGEDRAYWANVYNAENCEEIAKLLEKDVNELIECLKWYIQEDETNEGDTPLPDHGGYTWNEINDYWIDGKKRAIAALAKFGEEV